MAADRPRFEPVTVLTLGTVRRFVRAHRSRGAVVFFGLLYVLGAVFASGMVAFGRFDGGYTAEVVLGNPTGVAPWNYPGLFIVAPWGVVTLPFFPTVAMLVVGAGVGLGMAVAAILTVRLLRPSPADRARSKAVGAMTGLTPAMISLVTLGACCSTTAAATAGVGLVADASATSVSNLLLNNWLLGVFQIAIVYVSLVAQELLLTVYRGLFDRTAADEPRLRPAPWPAWVGVGALRVALLSGGLLWILSVLVASTQGTDPLGNPIAWAGWIVQRGVVGGLAVAVALVPDVSLRTVRRWTAGSAGPLVAGILTGAGASLFLVYPASMAAAGWVGLPTALGAGGASAPIPLAVVLVRGVLEIGLPGAITLATGLAPAALGRWLERGLPYSDPAGRPAGTAAGGAAEPPAIPAANRPGVDGS